MKKKILLMTVPLVVVAVGLYAGYHYLWWFTPAYSQRQTVQAFFKDVSSGNDTQAYNLTSSVFQADNPYPQFQAEMGTLKGRSVGISYNVYSAQSGWTTIEGQMNDKTTKNSFTFGMQVSNNSKTNKIGVLNFTQNT